MKRCKHENAIALAWSRDRKYCRRCFATIPLGPAADSPDAIVELRAAELATALDGHTGALTSAGFTGDEVMGWLIARHDLMGPPTSSQHAGYLARLIYEHKEEA